MELNMINKIGIKTEQLLNKINIYSIEDLVTYYPYRYEFINIKTIDKIDENESYVISTIISDVKTRYVKRNLNYLTFMAISNNINFKVIIFNRVFLKNNLTINRKILLVGKYNKLKNTFMASNIIFNNFTNRIESIYHLTKGITNESLSKFISDGINISNNTEDYIPSYIVDKYNLLSKGDALKFIHFPSNIVMLKQAKLRLIYEELFQYMFKINYLKKITLLNSGIERNIDYSVIEDFISSLPFKLTMDQLNAIKVIYDDLTKNKRMNRLILGDVGSGKTIVAIVAILMNYLGGYQSSFMAPTEILAKQHYENLKNYFNNMNINIRLLTGGLTSKEKNKIYQEIKNNEVDIIIGTHSLLNDEVEFYNLGLVITDEQHRFGVNQRKTLQNKGVNAIADVLYLSATPIPRTYALTIYGDVDITEIKSKPKTRKEVITKVILEKNIREVLCKVKEELENNHQIFIVSPSINDDEASNLKSVGELKNNYHDAFKDNVNIEIIHGKMKPKEKDKIMMMFQQGNIDILISTTVIEVGIDIPNASVMIIYNAERFGLATLHQLRGRVGRGSFDAYCYLVTNNINNERLKVMEESNDGFYISAKDFEQRGPGDLFGVKQSGDMKFKIANIKNDYKILKQCNTDSKEFIAKKLYIGNKLYENIISQISFLD